MVRGSAKMGPKNFVKRDVAIKLTTGYTSEVMPFKVLCIGKKQMKLTVTSAGISH